VAAEVADDEAVEVGDAPATAADAGAVDDDVKGVRLNRPTDDAGEDVLRDLGG
jgi:hypothetical protein